MHGGSIYIFRIDDCKSWFQNQETRDVDWRKETCRRKRRAFKGSINMAMSSRNSRLNQISCICKFDVCFFGSKYRVLHMMKAEIFSSFKVWIYCNKAQVQSKSNGIKRLHSIYYQLCLHNSISGLSLVLHSFMLSFMLKRK